MSRSTLSPDTPKLDTVLVTRVGPMMGYAFGVATDGLAVFISAGLAKRLGVTPGDRVEGAIVPNKNKPDATPWYLREGIVTSAGEQRAADIEALISVLDTEGGAWNRTELADRLDDQEQPWEHYEIRATAAMEVAHKAGQVSKIVLFSHESEERTVWYTRYPDRIDVDEFDDSEGEEG
jgi:hypothetical protein